MDGFGALSARLGQEPEPMLARFGFPPEVLKDRELRIDYKAFCGLLETCAEEWNCPDFGLRLAQEQRLGMLGLVGLVARLAKTVGDALVALRDHIAVHSTGFDVTLDRAPDGPSGRLARIAYTASPSVQAGRQALELAVLVIRNIVAEVAGQPSLVPDRVTVAAAPPADTLLSRRYLRCPVRYSDAETAVWFERRLLDRPTAIHDPTLEPLVRDYLEQLKRESGADIVELTRRMIGRLLTSGQCSHDRVAELLRLHPRNFQRRLSERGTTFSRLLDEYRHALAMDLIARHTMPMAQVAHMLGYADQSVFNQAFRRWTGMAPGQLAKSGRRPGAV